MCAPGRRHCCTAMQIGGNSYLRAQPPALRCATLLLHLRIDGCHAAVIVKLGIIDKVGDPLQAAFGAPIGGVLFSMEEACTHWSRKVNPWSYLHTWQLLDKVCASDQGS